MKIITVKDVIRKDVPIYYRLLYTGVAVIELTGKAQDCRVDFSIEIKPTGMKEITVSFLDDLHCPLIPVSKALKEYIGEMDANGTLPE